MLKRSRIASEKRPTMKRFEGIVSKGLVISAYVSMSMVLSPYLFGWWLFPSRYSDFYYSAIGYGMLLALLTIIAYVIQDARGGLRIPLGEDKTVFILIVFFLGSCLFHTVLLLYVVGLAIGS